jgi:hypothetical protein
MKPNRVTQPAAPRSHAELKAAYLAGAVAGRPVFDGWSTEEIAAWSRRVMFGENDEAFPGQAEWSRVVD